MIEKNLETLREKIRRACERAGREMHDIRIVLVTKTIPCETVMDAYGLGCRDFGENRVREWLDKKEMLPDNIHWHLIGHLQTNKVKFCVGRADLIHSVDSLKLANTINKEASQKKLTVDCLVQVNTSGEASKFGVQPNDAEKLAADVGKLPHLRLKGLMTIGPLTEDPKKTRESFRLLRELFEKIKKSAKPEFEILSMGMSSDFEIAIEEGSNLVRIGTAVFGERK